MKHILHYIFFFCFVFGACNEDIKPDIFPPTLTLYEAREITRTSAIISGNILLNGKGIVSKAHFLYATDPQYSDAQKIKIDTTEGDVEAHLTNLKPGQKYYYSLIASNGYNDIKTPISNFQTFPNTAPSIENISLVYKGPLSAAVCCKVTNNGGEPLTSLGFKYQKIGNPTINFISAECDSTGFFQTRLSDLDMDATYQVWAYAANTVGDTNSITIKFHTDSIVYLAKAGMLPEIIQNEEKYKLTTLNIAGEINGTDIRLIREIAGISYTNSPTPGQLSSLNLAEARIVAGGRSYTASRYTETDILGFATFANCTKLKEIILPYTLKVINSNAFKNCRSLTSITIPDNVINYEPSDGCIRLEKIQVSKLNKTYSAEDGILYDKHKETLLQFPEGKITKTIQFPKTVKKLSDYSLQHCQADSIIIPHNITELGREVFRNSSIQYIELSIDKLPTATFQGCTSLKTVKLGQQLMYISAYCFDQCYIQHLYISTPVPPVCDKYAFHGTNILSNCILHVPKGSKHIYRQNTPWENFSTILEE